MLEKLLGIIPIRRQVLNKQKPINEFGLEFRHKLHLIKMNGMHKFTIKYIKQFIISYYKYAVI